MRDFSDPPKRPKRMSEVVADDLLALVVKHVDRHGDQPCRIVATQLVALGRL